MSLGWLTPKKLNTNFFTKADLVRSSEYLLCKLWVVMFINAQVIYSTTIKSTMTTRAELNWINMVATHVWDFPDM